MDQSKNRKNHSCLLNLKIEIVFEIICSLNIVALKKYPVSSSSSGVGQTILPEISKRNESEFKGERCLLFNNPKRLSLSLYNWKIKVTTFKMVLLDT